jgi:hypothetical protein
MDTKYVVAILIVVMVMVILTACAGPKGDVGFTGPQGAVGATGPIGNSGQDGQDATPVTVVQLCLGTPSYGTYVEVAFCIDNELYATYSFNGGFSTKLSPGAYSSNAINSSCNFTVIQGCEISN